MAPRRNRNTQSTFENEVDRGDRSNSEVRVCSSRPDENRVVDWKGFSDISKLLPEFDGLGDISSWLSRVEEYSQIYNMSDLATRHFALLKLTGSAKVWLDGLGTVNFEWQEWRKLLLENFPTNGSALERRRRAESYRRKAGEEILQYYFQKLSLCNQAAMKNDEIIELIVEGLHDSRYRSFLGPLRRYDRTSELLIDLKEADNYYKIEKNQALRSVNSSTNQYKGVNQMNNKTNSISSIRRTDGTDTANVTKKLICFKCGKEGHFARNCGTNKLPNNPSTQNSSNVNPKVLHVEVNTHQKFFKKAEINGQSIDCYIDLGSSCTVLRSDIADRIGVTFYEDENLVKLKGYGGGEVQPVGVTTLVLKVGDVSAKVKVFIVEPEFQSVPILVGHSFTEQPHIHIIANSDGLIIQQREDSGFNKIGVRYSTGKTDLIAKETTVIPSGYIGHIQVATDFERDEVLHVDNRLQENGTAIPNCVIQSTKKSSIVPVANFTDNPIDIKKGSVLTRAVVCMPYDEIRDASNCNKNERQIESQQIVTDDDNSEVLKIMNEYKDVVSTNMSQLGLTDKVQMEIQLKESSKPVYYRPYRLSHYERGKVQEMIEDLKSNDVIEDCSSEYASPIILVKKKTGEYRLCIDYRKLNSNTVKDHYPIPQIDDQLDRLGRKRYFTSLDLYSGYYQVPVSEKSRDKTAFITPDGHYQFKRMPFGLCNAPAVFQRLINTILGRLRFSVAMAYLDDILIATETRAEGIENLKIILEVIRESNLTINLTKCRFLMRRINYLGFEISGDGIQPGQVKIESLVRFPLPNDQKGVRSFLGLASYFRRFVRNFAVIARPLTDLLSKNSNFIWEDSQQQAFESIKKALVPSPILKVFDPTSATELHTDACAIGVGAVLLQKQADDKLHPVAYYSRRTSSEESRYHSIELEALAIVSALDKFRIYLLGIPFVIRTDCNSLKLMESKRDLNPRVARWFMKLLEFDYRIEYQKGTVNKVADALSRYPIEDENIVLGISVNTDWVACMQRGCTEIEEIMKNLDVNEELKNKYTIYKGRLYKISKERWRLYVPGELRSYLINEAHINVSHMGVDKTLSKLKETYYFPTMREQVSKYVNRCINCLYYKVPTGKPPGFLHPLDKGNVPFVTVHIDHLGPFVRTKDKRKYVLCIVDGFSKFTWLKAVKTVESVETASTFLEFMFCYGRPQRIISDRGGAFTGRPFLEMCRSYNIQHVKVGSHTPRANGQAEVANKTILTGLRTLSTGVECSDWDTKLLEVMWSMNNAVHRVTQKTPTNLVFRYVPNGPKDNPLTCEINSINKEVGNDIEVDFNQVSELIVKDQGKQKEYYDRKRRGGNSYMKGDIVMVRWNPVSTGTSLKLSCNYSGPYMIDKVLDKDRYVVKDIDGEQQSSRKYEAVVSIDRLKKIVRSSDFDAK